MGRIPTRDEALEILSRYNQKEFLLKHARIVGGVLAYFAREHAPDEVGFWEVVGLLHDLDFEQWPDEHCVRSQAILRELGMDERLIRAVASHGFGLASDVEPEHIMEKILFAADELTGLIGATALLRPSRSIADLETKSVLKKFRTPSFAAGCSREVIQQGADRLGWDLETLVDRTLAAMKSLLPDMAL